MFLVVHAIAFGFVCAVGRWFLILVVSHLFRSVRRAAEPKQKKKTNTRAQRLEHLFMPDDLRTFMFMVEILKKRNLCMMTMLKPN